MRYFTKLVPLAAVLVIPAASNASLVGHPPCYGGKTVAANQKVRVYLKNAKSDDPRLIACRFADSKRRTLLKEHDTGFRDTRTLHGLVVLNGSAVGYEKIVGHAADPARLDDVTLHSWSAKTLKRRLATPVRHAHTLELVVTRKAALAWTEVGGGGVFAMDAAGLRTLGTGAVHGLGVEITIVSWFNGDDERFARLN
jgi:hypothetical protein